jgi:CRISPR-associated protein Cas1
LIPLYINLEACNIGLNNYELVIKNAKTGKELRRFKPRQIFYDSLIIQRAHGSISFGAITWLIAHNIPVTLLDWKGNVKAQILPSTPISGKLRIAQYQSYVNKETRLKITRTITETKLERSKGFLESLSDSYDIEIPRIEELNAVSMDFMRSQEARYANDYFIQYGRICKQIGYTFRGRKQTKSNTHASDLVNCLLNYGYALMQSYVSRSINAIGLDDSVSFLHSVDKSRSLVFDMQELWRINVDYSVLKTLEQLKLKGDKDAYSFNDNYELRLSEDTINMLFDNVRFNLSLQELILNCRNLAKFILGESELSFKLKPVDVKKRFENDLVFQSVLEKTARQLGMNKSTHWYQRKQLKEKGALRLYRNTRQYFSTE